MSRSIGLDAEPVDGTSLLPKLLTCRLAVSESFER